MGLRIALGAAGIALGLYGVARLLTGIPSADLVQLVIWLVAALVLHDGVLSPLLVVVGAVVSRIPATARTAVQGGLVAGGIVTVVALPLIHRAHSAPPQKALLEQDYTANLGILLGLVALGSLVTYVVLRARRRAA